jgi:hypothetical protein
LSSSLLPTITSSELYARVAIQLVKISYRKSAAAPISPSDHVTQTADHLPIDGFGMVRFALHSLAVSVSLGTRTDVWLRNVSYRAGMGGNFRRHFFEGYKESRRPYPRVTNRGVQSSTTASISRIGRVKRNA